MTSILSGSQLPATSYQLSRLEAGSWKLPSKGPTSNRLEAESWKLEACYPNHSTIAAVANKFNTAAGSSHFQPNSIS